MAVSNCTTKKVLVVGYLHPYTRPGGSYRILPLATHLHEFGWEPVVLTPYLSTDATGQFKNTRKRIKEHLGAVCRVLPVDFVLTRIGEIINYPDAHRGWKSCALEAGNEFLQQEGVDAIVSCHPITSHIVASILSTQHRVPWVADFADLWSQNHNYSYSRIRQIMDKRLECKTLEAANALVTISEPWSKKLSDLHGNKPVYTITHGFDADIVCNGHTGLTTKFTITYAGSIYAHRQNPAVLFTALRDLISDGVVSRCDIDVRFYGFNEPWLNKEISRYGLSDIAKQYGRVSKEVAVQKQRESQLLLLLDWDDSQEKGVYTTKIFEYLGARRPILATGGSDDDVVAKLLARTKAGVHTRTVEDTKKIIGKLYQEYKLSGGVAYKGEESEIVKHSHREMVGRFAEVLDSVISK